MKRIRTMMALLTLLVWTMSAAACGGGGGGGGAGVPGNGTSSTPDMSGNWSMHATSAQADAYVGGVLTQSGEKLSGVFHVVNSTCYDVMTDVPVTGTISGNTAQLTTASVDSQVLTATLTAAANGGSATGTYKITGGCGGGDAGQLSGNRIPPYTGTWKGSFQSSSGVQVGVAANITQTGPDAHGWYQLSGTVTFQNSTCFTQGTITNSIASGDLTLLAIATNDTPAGEVDFAGLSNTAGNSLAGQYQINSGACIGDSGSGTLTRQ